MKVIQSGDQRGKGWKRQYICSGKGNDCEGCGAVLLVEQSDLFHTTSGARDEVEYHATFCCPECGAYTDIPSRDLPGHLYIPGLPAAPHPGHP